MTVELPEIWFVAPGRIPDPRGTPLAVRWLAEAWAEYGGRSRIYTSGQPAWRPALDRSHRQKSRVTYRRVGAASDPRPGIRPRRALTALRLSARIRRDLGKATSPPVLHGHHVDGALAARLACMRNTPIVSHAHTRLSKELAYARQSRRPSSFIGHVLDRLHRLAEHTVVYNFQDSPNGVVVPPVLPNSDAIEIETCRSEPAATPTAVYLGNPDAYQDLEKLVELAARNPGLAIRCVSHDLPSNRVWKAIGDRVEWRRLSTVDQVVNAASDAWWGLCPRTLFAGYPFKAVTYTALGLPVLACHDWGPPAEWRPIHHELDLSEPPKRLERGRVQRASRLGLRVLERIYREALQQARGER